MMASAFFDGPGDRDYIRSMLELYLAPPGGGGRQYTLPLLVCGSPLYDPQAPGWFRTRYKDHLPTRDGIPQMEVLQTGCFRVRPDSERATPYLGANHMIAAGVTGRCTNDPSKIPDIRKYEAQDLVAASFLYAYANDLDLDPQEAEAAGVPAVVRQRRRQRRAEAARPEGCAGDLCARADGPVLLPDAPTPSEVQLRGGDATLR